MSSKDLVYICRSKKLHCFSILRRKLHAKDYVAINCTTGLQSCNYLFTNIFIPLSFCPESSPQIFTEKLAKNPAFFNLYKPLRRALRFPFGVVFFQTSISVSVRSNFSQNCAIPSLAELFQILLSEIAHDNTDGNTSENELLSESI